MSNEYTCKYCSGTFTKGWTDKEAKAELEDNYPGFTEDDCALICDDCYKEITVNAIVDYLFLKGIQTDFVNRFKAEILAEFLAGKPPVGKK